MTTTFGQLCLLAAFVGSGYAAFASFIGWRRESTRLQRGGEVAGVVGFLALTVVSVILAVALLVGDFRFAYVAQYSSRQLPWYYALSAFWVGQAGSLLFWALSVGVLAMLFRFWPRRTPSPLLKPAFAVLLAYQCFLVAIMVFGADPMQPGLAVPRDGAGLSPLLQHPAMLLHPPVVFLGYAACAIPFALAVAALFSGQLNADWARAARPWTFFAWAVLGIGILLGAYWAYEELGWGGYWDWDPVENGSLIPWLVATALIHASMAYRQRGILKKTTLLLAVAAFAACNFAAFLTRSGIFSSLHAFSQSPIGWMFLLLFVILVAGTLVLVVQQRSTLVADDSISSLWAREGTVAASVFVLLLLATAVFVGTVSLPISQVFFPHKVLVGEGFYNNVLIPTGLLLLILMAAAPLTRWGAPPEKRQWQTLALAAIGGTAIAALAWRSGLRHPLEIVVAGLAAVTVATFLGAWILDVRNGSAKIRWVDLLRSLRLRRRSYAGYLMHLGVACLAIGVTGSSLGTQQHELTLRQGETIRWAGRDVCFVGLRQHSFPDKLVVQAELEVTDEGTAPYTVLPSQEYYFLQNEWRTKVAIHSSWSGDFYTILHSGEGQDRVRLTLVENPMMRWMWLSGVTVLVGAVPWFWPDRRRGAKEVSGFVGATVALPPKHETPREKKIMRRRSAA